MAVFAALCCSAVLVGSASAAVGSGSISGEVSDASTADPVAGIEVCAEDTNEEVFRCATTDSQGEYTVTGLGTGNYRVEFWPPGPASANYVAQYFNGKSSWDEATLVHVVNGVNTPGIDAALAEGGWIEGRVADGVSGVGLSYALACAFPIDEQGTWKCALTDASGNYTIHGLAADAYEVAFYAGDSDHLGQYYNGKTNWFEATPVSVVAGAGTTEINAGLARGGHIAGTVSDAASGSGLGLMSVCVFDANSEELDGCTATDSAGHYSYGALLSGAYRVGFSLDEFEEEEDDYVPQFFSGKPALAQSDLIEVTAPNTTGGIDAHLVNRKAPPAAPAATQPSSQPQPTTTLLVKPKPKKKCRRGFKRVHAHSKTRCVRIQRHHRPHRHHH